MMKSQYYSINGANYQFKPLVIGQYRQLSNLNVNIDDNLNDKEIFKAYLSEIPASKIMAILLHPLDYDMCRKDIDKLENEIDFQCTPNELDCMVSDFFDLCPLDEVLKDLTAMAKAGARLKGLI